MGDKLEIVCAACRASLAKLRQRLQPAGLRGVVANGERAAIA